MKTLLILLLFIGTALSQSINFGDQPKDDIVERGLLADKLNKHPTAQSSVSSSGKLVKGGRNSRFCCCISRGNCPNPNNNGGGGGGSFTDFINPRDSLNNENNEKEDDGLVDVAVRIQNDPAKDGSSSQSTDGRCQSFERTCCYNTFSELSRVGGVCRPPRGGGGGSSNERWEQKCQERNRPRCGRRNPNERVFVQGAEAKPNEFPWTCLVLKGNNDFVGTCAIVPSRRDNDVLSGTNRVITAAHKLKSLQPRDLLKVRILEYDASGFKQGIENRAHREYEVTRFRNHPQYNATRLSYDLSVLYLNTTIQLVNNPGVSAACLPTCRDMFSHQFINGTGTRCWVAGWGKDKFGSQGKFQFRQNKVDLPLVNDGRCDRTLKQALRESGSRDWQQFSLSRSELCAGGERGKDACTGDGGAPLVCQANSGSWYVVGLVTWGVKCGQEGVPAAYADVFEMVDFITSPSFG